VRDTGAEVAGYHLQRGGPAGAIDAIADKIGADLIVLGSRGLGPIKRLALGSVADEVVHAATHPVLVLHGGAASWPPARIVIGDDGSATAAVAASLAAVIGGCYGAQGTLVRAYPPLPTRFTMADPLVTPTAPEERSAAGPTPPQLLDETIGEVERELTARAVALVGAFGAQPEVRVAMSDPAASMLTIANDGAGPALIAVGARGLGLFQRLRLGSVSTKILHAAAGAVLIVPPRRTASSTVAPLDEESAVQV
jgi:nucleotide-binding universal stress UspA family protein